MKAPLAPAAILLKTLPDTVHTELFARLFTHLLKGQWIADQLVDLESKRICISITDTGNNLLFAVHGRGVYRIPAKGQRWDVCIRGNLEDFWKLATRTEDPDTLFFNRRLAIEGETETGLYLKNMLDALDFDWQAHLEAVLGPRMAGIAQRLAHTTGLDRRISRALDHH